jgi:hypothetical protein
MTAQPTSDPKTIAADIVRELKDHPERWTQGHWARDYSGKKVHWNDPGAVCWCLEGHINKRGGDTGDFGEAAGTRDDCFTGLASFNDKYDIASVIELCEKVANG